MMQCRQCERQSAVNEEELCQKCAQLSDQARYLIERDELPKFSVHEFRVTAGRSRTSGQRCALCGDVIKDAEHSLILNVEIRRRQWRGDLHFHDICHSIWEEQGTVG